MKMEWSKYTGKTLNVTMHENYGIVEDPAAEQPVYEIVFKSGKLETAFDDGLLLNATRDSDEVRIFIPFDSIKCVEIFS